MASAGLDMGAPVTGEGAGGGDGMSFAVKTGTALDRLRGIGDGAASATTAPELASNTHTPTATPNRPTTNLRMLSNSRFLSRHETALSASRISRQVVELVNSTTRPIARQGSDLVLYGTKDATQACASGISEMWGPVPHDRLFRHSDLRTEMKVDSDQD
jgi:hypothetical protein